MIDRAIEMERNRRNRIRQNLETIDISHRIRRIKAHRRKRLEYEVFSSIYSGCDGCIDLEAEEDRLHRTLIKLNMNSTSSSKPSIYKRSIGNSHSSELLTSDFILLPSGSQENRRNINCNDADHKSLDN
ncbi:unnamed protein product [Hymenolepis diminuta]|uniref:Uncharacterized protein n=1 Tax=Hymenolepis diminuta TaxID=6216 RepID=A0A564XYA2_HYMDI|nr:unnamed protein product [Hymenolepis diminuta]